jgi:hypothetical protein
MHALIGAACVLGLAATGSGIWCRYCRYGGNRVVEARLSE